ncbi:hypothetical protein QBC39DRAFT_420211 [Podospora conica]|nr:hypothetical protein QBC39DRAFT_420211 [Schizothecium conicum]
MVPIIAPLDAEELKRQDLLREVDGGESYLHKRLMKPSSDEKYRDIPLSFGGSPIDWDYAFMQLPTYLLSLQTLLFLGLGEAKASEVWELWTRRVEGWRNFYGEDPDERVDKFGNFILRQVFELPSGEVRETDEQWAEVLAGLQDTLTMTPATAPMILWTIDITNGAKGPRPPFDRVCYAMGIITKRLFRLNRIRKTSMYRESIIVQRNTGIEGVERLTAGLSRVEIGLSYMMPPLP